jgi:hypothetical protein
MRCPNNTVKLDKNAVFSLGCGIKIMDTAIKMMIIDILL